MVGSATVVSTGRSTTFTVRDLSAGGVLLIGARPFRPGERIDIVFDADGDRLTGLWLLAEVVRCEPLAGGRHAIGATFRNLAVEIHEHIQELVAIALERRRASAPPTVLVVDEAPHARHAVVRDLVTTGQRVVAASTPLEVVRHLHDADLRIEAALVDARFGDTNGLAILAYIADEHPGVRRILLTERARMRDYEVELTSGRAHAFLTKPWERQCLVAALHTG